MNNIGQTVISLQILVWTDIEGFVSLAFASKNGRFYQILLAWTARSPTPSASVSRSSTSTSSATGGGRTSNEGRCYQLGSTALYCTLSTTLLDVTDAAWCAALYCSLSTTLLDVTDAAWCGQTGVRHRRLLT